jgi:hypothetical protein
VLGAAADRHCARVAISEVDSPTRQTRAPTQVGPPIRRSLSLALPALRQCDSIFENPPRVWWIPSVSDLEFRHFFLGAGKTRIYFIAINFQRVATAGTTENFGKKVDDA